MPGALETISQAARDPDLRRLQVVLAAFAVTEHATWVALVVHAFERGGVNEAGLVAVLLLIPCLFAAPLTAVAADRFPGDRVLAIASVLLSASCGLVAVVMWLDLGVVAYALIAATAVAVTVGRPTVSAVLPAATHVPAELTAANVVFGAIENAGMLAGPALAAALIAVWSPAAVFVACGSFMVVSLLACVGIRLEPSHLVLTTALTPRQVLRDTFGGLATLRRERGVRLAILMVAIAAIGNGVCDVLIVVVADVIDPGGTDKAGILGAAFGVGSLLGSAVMVTMIGRARITPFLVAGVLLMSLPLVVIAAITTYVSAVVLFAVMGLGGSVVMIAATTMVQRIARSDVLGRTFGLVEGLRQGSIALGSAAVTVAVATSGVEEGLVAVGVGMLLLLALRLMALLRVDRGATPPDQRVVELLVGDRITGVLSAPSIERLAQSARRVDVTASSPVVVQGQEGSEYYLIDVGQVSVRVDGRDVRTLGPGDGFGEIAAIEGTRRTATVTAVEATRLVVIDPEVFIEAVTGHPRGLASVAHRTAGYVGLPGSLPHPRPVQVFPRSDPSHRPPAPTPAVSGLPEPLILDARPPAPMDVSTRTPPPAAPSLPSLPTLPPLPPGTPPPPEFLERPPGEQP